MKKESKYIFRRVVSGVLISIILMSIRSCNVHAETLTPTNVYSYNGTTNSSYTGTSLQTITKNSIQYIGPIIPANRNFDSIRFRFQNVSFANDNNLRQLSFTGQSGVGIPVVYIQNGSRLYGCYVNSDIYNDTDANNVEHVYVGYMFNVICPNVDLNGTDISIWYKYSGIGRTSNINDILLSKNFSIALMSNNSDVVNAISSQTNESHQDAIDTQNKIDNIDDTLNNSNVDNQGNFFSGFDEGSTGTLMDLISLPLDFVGSLNNSCQSITLPKLKMFSFELDLTIPCLSSYVYNQFGTTLINTIRLIINGLLIYRMLKWFIDFIQELKDPNNDDLEVMDL